MGARKAKMMKESDFHVVKGKKGEESDASSSPAKKEKDKAGEGVEEGEIRSSNGKEKRRGDSESRDRSSRDRDGRDSRERDSHSRDMNGQGDMGPPATSRSTPRRSVDPDAGDRDPKRRRGEEKKEKDKSP